MHQHRSAFKKALFCLGVLSLALCCTAAVAQQGRGVPPAKDPSAWEMQAKYVAKSLELSPELTTKLVDAYKAARDSQFDARAKAREAARAEGGGGGRGAAWAELNKAEKAKFETALKAFLDPEQATKALAALGGFSNQWDAMVKVLDDMKLEDAKSAEAMKLVADYVAASDKARDEAVTAGNMQGMMEKMRPLREKLNADMAKILTPEQLTKWTEATAMRGGRGGRGGGPEGGGAPAAASSNSESKN